MLGISLAELEISLFVAMSKGIKTKVNKSGGDEVAVRTVWRVIGNLYENFSKIDAVIYWR